MDIMSLGSMLLGIGSIVFIVLLITFVTPIDYMDHHCSVCEWNYVHHELLNYKDVGYGHVGALRDIWHSANYGKEVNLKWYENYRVKYNLTDVPSFDLINYSNSCPHEPDLKYIGTGYITNFTQWSYDGPAYSITVIQINGTNFTFNNCRWNPYPYNKSSLTHVFRRKNSRWFNQFREASLYDATINVNLPESVNQSWDNYYEKYQWYLDNDGVKIGSRY